MRFLVTVLEAHFAHQYIATMSATGTVQDLQKHSSWNPAPYLDHHDGLRLIEELGRRCQAIFNEQKKPFDGIAISSPGTVDENSTILGSTRLGIKAPADFTAEMRKLNLPPCHVFHDVECLAIGEARHGRIAREGLLVPHAEHFGYVFIDEGIGCTLFINGRPHRGAGVAGHLGRMVVQPMGTYNKTFCSRGPLEVFASRPWVSANIVAEYLSERDKRGGAPASSEAFRAAVATASEGDWAALTIEHIAAGIGARDPIVTTVLEDAAQYLSIAINAIITIVNPPLIILGGEMIQKLPDFAATVISLSRRHAWSGSWNETQLRVAEFDRLGQAYGAAELLRDLLSNSAT
jgi:glucokinase